MKRVALGLTLFLALSLLPAYSATPPKAGSVCEKQGITKTFKGKKFTCIKSGKKLVWNKGVTVRKPTPTPTPTPTTTPNTTPTPTPTPSPTSTPFPIPSVSSSPTPTPILEFQISGSDSLLPASACRLSDSSGNNFHLGFPITPIIKDLSRIRIFAVPFEFSDSTNFRLSKEQNDKMFDSIEDYYLQESYGKTKLEFAFPPNKTGSGESQALSFDFELKESIFKPNFRFRDADVTSYINQLLSKTELTWNLGSYDSVILYSQDSRTFNLFGGQAWRGTEDSKINQFPFDSPSGKIRSLVFASGIPSVMIHELGHSLFGFIDLYDQNAGQLFAQGWGLLASAYTGEMNLRGWEKWLTGWISSDEVRCTNVQSLHYLKFIASQSNSSKLLIHPLDSKRAVVVEAIDTNLIAQENRGYLNFCDKVSFCLPHMRTGLLAYTIDVSKLSALGSLVVPEILKFPNLLADGNEIAVSGVIVKNLGCDKGGCFVSVRR